MSRLQKTIRHDSQTSTDFISNKRVDRQTFIRKDISGWDCEGDWGFGTVVAILCVYQKLGAIKIELEVKSKKKGKLTIQCDEMWSFVGNKEKKQWIWLAIDVSTKEIVGVYIGKRAQAGAQGLWDSRATCLSSMCRKLHRLLERLWNSFSSKKTQGSRKGHRSDKLYRKI